MKLNNSNLLTKLVSIVGVTGVGLLIVSPSGANEYKKPLLVVQQNSGGKVLNPRPSIFNEPPYNRSRTSPGEATPPTGTPTTPETTPPTGTPTTPETTPPTGTPNTPPLPSQKPSSSNGSKDLIALAQSNSQFTTLSRALKAAGLTETLKGKGPFTIFAPTNAAFAELPQDAVAELFKPENKEVLVKILTYHVVSGQVLSTDLKSGEVKSIEGSPISVKVDGKNGVMVNDAKVTQTDLKASNGVIHVINKVILPPNL